MVTVPLFNVLTVVVDTGLQASLEAKKAVSSEIQRHLVHCLGDSHFQLIQAVDRLAVHLILHPTPNKKSMRVRSGLRAGQ